ncbi:MAG: hypothetical protein JOZ87_33415 [Chloroflexi bacterium]|nr:hypothetical protein [Chloroflexota bacterium]
MARGECQVAAVSSQHADGVVAFQASRSRARSAPTPSTSWESAVRKVAFGALPLTLTDEQRAQLAFDDGQPGAVDARGRKFMAEDVANSEKQTLPATF